MDRLAITYHQEPGTGRWIRLSSFVGRTAVRGALMNLTRLSERHSRIRFKLRIVEDRDD